LAGAREEVDVVGSYSAASKKSHLPEHVRVTAELGMRMLTAWVREEAEEEYKRMEEQ
jgi:hypothetical protein